MRLHPVRRGGKFGFIDREGKLAIPAEFTEAWDFRGGLARVRVSDRFGYVDEAGRYVREPTR